MKILIKNVRLAFPNLFKATAPATGGEPAFSASFLLAPSHPQFKELEAAIASVAKEKWQAKADVTLKALKSSDKTCLHNGDAKSEYDGFEGMFYISTRSKTRPTVVAGDRSPLSAEDGKPYAGCFVDASIEIWAQDNNFGKRINAQLRGVQFRRDGDAFGGGSKPADADEFEEISTADDELTA